MNNSPSKGCPKCGGLISFQLNNTSVKQNRHGFIYWLLIGWWLHPLLYFFATIPMILWRILKPNNKQKTHVHTYGLCQNCGYTIKK